MEHKIAALDNTTAKYILDTIIKARFRTENYETEFGKQLFVLDQYKKGIPKPRMAVRNSTRFESTRIGIEVKKIEPTSSNSSKSFT